MRRGLCLQPPRPGLSRHKAQGSVTPSGLGSNAASSWGPLLTDRASDNLLGPRDQAGTCARTADPRSARGPSARGRRGSGMLCARLCARGARLTLLMASAPTGARPARRGVDVRQRRLETTVSSTDAALEARLLPRPRSPQRGARSRSPSVRGTESAVNQSLLTR